MTFNATKALFAAGQTETALQQLMELTANADKETYHSVILLRAAWEYQEREAINGTLTFEEANLQRNRITKGALDLITDFESNGVITNMTQSGIQKDLWNTQTAALMQVIDNDQTSIQGSTIRAEGEANVIIGEGNTVNKKIVSGFGMRQYITILISLIVVIGGGYFAYKTLFKEQNKAYVSLSEIQKELAKLSDSNGKLQGTSDKDRIDIETELTKGMKAMKEKDYATAIKYLENVAQKVPASTVYQNISYAYGQIGKPDQANAALAKAKEVHLNVATANSSTQLNKRINLIDPENGGRMVAATSPANKGWTDGKEYSVFSGAWTIYGFKDGAKAKVNELKVLIPKSDSFNPNEIKISYNNDSPTGNFTLIDTFKPFNALMGESPFQSFTFPPISAKYIKIECYSSDSGLYMHEVQLWGTIE